MCRMERIDAALIREQGVEFAVVVVKTSVLDNPSQSAKAEAQRAFGRYFPGIPIVLMAQRSNGRAEYFGRRDIVDFLANTPVEALPWKEYTFS